MHKARARVKNHPDVVYHLTMRPHHVKVESVWVLALEVPEKGLAESSCFDYTTHCVPFEECVEFCDGSVQGLC